MAEGTLFKHPPRGILRLLLRAPVWLYHFRLGWMLGDRLIMITHLGRKSGRLRHTVLEVVEYHSVSDTYFVASGWGTKADWYQNLSKTPQLLLDDGRRRYEAIAEQPAVETAAQALAGYARRSPMAFRNLGRLMLGTALPADDQGCRRLAEVLPMLALRARV